MSSEKQNKMVFFKKNALDSCLRGNKDMGGRWGVKN
jgi:hypothetical protein